MYVLGPPLHSVFQFEVFTRSTSSLHPAVDLLGMNGRKSSVGKSQKSILSFFGQGKPAGKPKPVAVHPDPPASALAQQGANGNGVKRDRQIDNDDNDDDDDALCIDASPVSKAKATTQPAVATHAKAKVAKTTDTAQPREAPDNELTQSIAPQPVQAVSQAATSKEDVPEQAEQVSQLTSQKVPSIPARDPKRQKIATRKFAIKRQRFQLGEDQKSCKKTAAKYTPLEKQVVELKKNNPGFVLLVEVRIVLCPTEVVILAHVQCSQDAREGTLTLAL